MGQTHLFCKFSEANSHRRHEFKNTHPFAASEGLMWTSLKLLFFFFPISFLRFIFLFALTGCELNSGNLKEFLEIQKVFFFSGVRSIFQTLPLARPKDTHYGWKTLAVFSYLLQVSLPRPPKGVKPQTCSTGQGYVRPWTVVDVALGRMLFPRHLIGNFMQKKYIAREQGLFLCISPCANIHIFMN